METDNSNPLATKVQGRWAVSPEAYDVVRRMRANGCSQATIAAAIGVPPSTFRDLLDGRDLALAEAYEEGHGAMHDELVGHLMSAARSGNIASAIFLLKGSHGYREATPVKPTDTPTVNILIPAPSSPEDLAKLAASMRDVTPNADDETTKSKSKRLIK